MIAEKVEQLIQMLEKQELHVSGGRRIISKFLNGIYGTFVILQGEVSGQIYAELFAAYLYKGDL